jgi:protein TonB
MKDSLLSGFAISSLIHLALIPTASFLIAGTEAMKTTQRIEVSLSDIPAVEQKPEPTPAPKPEPKKVEKIKAPRLIHKTDIARVEPNEPPPKREELPPPPPNLTASGPEKGSVASQKQAGEATGAEAGVGGLFGRGDVSVAGGSGIGGGGGTADAGLGRGDKGDGFGGGGNGDGLAALARPLGGYQVKPRYPEAARKAGAQGVTLLRVRVLENGRVGEVLIEKSAGFRELDFSAAEAVKKWLFEPARRGKEPVQVWVLLPVKFELH